MGSPGAGGIAEPRRASRPRPAAPLAYFWGEDAFGIERAVAAFAASHGQPEVPLEVWRSPADEDAATDAAETGSSAARRRTRVLDEASARLGTAPLFGGGTLVVLRQPGWLVRDAASAARVRALVEAVPDGNALAFSDLTASGAKAPAAAGMLRDVVVRAGGTEREFPAPTRDRFEAWVTRRAEELGIRMGPGAARLLAERLGGYVRESDIDRRRQTEMANGELEKLAAYHPGGVISRDDVAALVAEAVPGSTWAFLDAVAARRSGESAQLAARLMDGGAPFPVLVSQLHRRLRELIQVREHLDSGAPARDLVRTMRLQPFRAQKLAEQAGAWAMPDLLGAFDGLLEMDLRSKGISLDGSTVQMSEARDALALQVWIAEHAPRH